MPQYWSYWEQGPSGWAYAVTGSSQTQVTYGSVNAWSWGEGIAPPPYSFQDLCPYGDAPVGLDGATATPTLELPPATATVEPELLETTPPTLEPTVPDEVVSTVAPADGVIEQADKPASGAGLLFFAVLMLGLGLGLSIVRKRRRPR
jgi:hypothetical protein